MLAKLNFLQSKYFIFTLAVMALLSAPLSADDTIGCEYRIFSVKVDEKVSRLDLLSQIADSCNFSIVVQDNIAQAELHKNLFGINIKNLSLEEIFDIIISDKDLNYEYGKNFLKISAIETKSFKIDYITSVRTGTATLNASVDATPTAEGETKIVNGDNTITSNDTFDFWGTLLAEVKAIMNTGAEEYIPNPPIINANAGLITVTGTKKQLERVQDYINVLQINLHRQVLIDVSILSVSLEENHKTGIDWSQFNLQLQSTAKYNTSNMAADGSAHTVYTNPIDTGLTFANDRLAIVSDALFTMDGLINFLHDNGDTKVISNPKVLTMNNQQALITIGDNINYRVPQTTTNGTTGNTDLSYDNFSIFIGVLLNITPEISENNEIILRINPSVSTFKYAEDDGKQANAREIAPDTSEKKLSTVVKVQNGNTIILGGLITNANGLENNNVPVLSDIPLFGEAFKSSTKSKLSQELVFVITPRIIGPKDDTRVTLKDLGYSKRVYEQ